MEYYEFIVYGYLKELNINKKYVANDIKSLCFAYFEDINLIKDAIKKARNKTSISSVIKIDDKEYKDGLFQYRSARKFHLAYSVLKILLFKQFGLRFLW